MKRSWAGVLCGLTLWACPPTPPPGDQPMGTWAMTATTVSAEACSLVEVDGAPFTFQAVLTRDSTSSTAWMTLAGYSREGTFDGQYLSTEASASRVFTGCGECQTRLVERIDVAVLSRTQAEALAGMCPDNVLDGGVPAPDGGVLAPLQTATGFDAVRLCGALVTHVESDGLADGGACEAKCSGCAVRYQLRGERR